MYTKCFNHITISVDCMCMSLGLKTGAWATYQKTYHRRKLALHQGPWLPTTAKLWFGYSESFMPPCWDVGYIIFGRSSAINNTIYICNSMQGENFREEEVQDVVKDGCVYRQKKKKRQMKRVVCSRPPRVNRLLFEGLLEYSKA